MSSHNQVPPQQQRRRRQQQQYQNDPRQRPAPRSSSSAFPISLVVIQCFVIVMLCSYFAMNAMLSSLALPETTPRGKTKKGKRADRSFLGRYTRHKTEEASEKSDITKAVSDYERALYQEEAGKTYDPDPTVPLEAVERVNEDGDGPLVLQAKNNRPDGGKFGERPIVAILAATRSDPQWGHTSNSAFQRFLLPSLKEFVTNEEIEAFDIRLHIAMDDDDEFWLQEGRWLDLMIPSYLKVYIHTFPNTDNRIPFNELATAARKDGATYFCRINDDTAFSSSPWIEQATAALANFDPPNLGVVGPTCVEGNEAILTHDFVHKTHLEIFEGLYYPSQFHNWYLDDWISNIYNKKVLGDNFHRAVKLTDWTVTHHLQARRYKSNENDAKFLPTLYKQGLEQIRTYMEEHYSDMAHLLKSKSSSDRDKDAMPENAQIGKEQVQSILDVLPEKGGSMLVWGLGNDSPYWHGVTQGNAVFIEDDFSSEKDGTQWFNFVMQNYPYLEGHKVTYTTQLKPDWERYHEHPERWGEELLIANFPNELFDRDWDVILVDAPLGCCGMGPGRYQSLYTTFVLVQKVLKRHPKKTIHVFVDDYERQVERDFSREVFAREPIKVVTRPPGASNSNEQAHFVFGGKSKTKKPKLLKHKSSSASSSYLHRLFGYGKLDLVKDKEAFEPAEEEKPKKSKDGDTAAATHEEKPKASRLGKGGLIGNAIRSQLQSRKKEPIPWTIVLTVNDGYYDFMLNWLLHYDKLELKDHRLVVIAEDDIVYGKLKDLGLPPEVMEIAKTKTMQDLQESQAYDSESYNAMVSTRATYLLKFVRDEGQNVLYSDVDTVWRSNPITYLDLPVYQSYDLILQIDDDEYNGDSPYYCTGFMALRSTSRTIKVLEAWEKKLKDKPQLNQPIFNKVLRQGKAKHFGLPRHRFPSGKNFFDKWGDEQRMEAIVVHNNYIVGHDAKRDRFRRHDLWHESID